LPKAVFGAKFCGKLELQNANHQPKAPPEPEVLARRAAGTQSLSELMNSVRNEAGALELNGPTTAVLLAAGLSRRMGSCNKLLLEIAGEPMVRRLARVYMAACTSVHAVIGFEAERVRLALRNLPLTIIENPRFAEGQATSVRAGLESLTGRPGAIVMALADQAALTAADIAALLGEFARGGGDRVLIPYYRGARGNPVVFPPGVVQEILASGPGADCRSFIDAHPERTRRYEAPNSHFVTDIDTPEDLRLLETIGLRGIAP
jgi:molybdenum cofactor cytidylyltransferase